MSTSYIITPELRTKFKEPFGTLIQGSFDETMNKMKELLEREKPPKVISVGDVVSHNLHEYKLHPQLTIVDNKFLRIKSLPEKVPAEKTIRVENPQGTITKEAISAIKKALEKNDYTHIIVDGEEDLLTLIAVLYAPENAIVVYGQPHSGIVVVEVTSEKKAQAREFLKAMRPSKS